MKKLIIPGVVIVSGIAWGYSALGSDVFKTGHPLLATSGPVELMDSDFSTEALPDGWAHRTFFRIKPTDYQMVEEDGRRALACTTDNSGSILARETSIQLADLPTLSWNWKISKPIESAMDEDTEDGDDHPARLFLRFENESGETKTTEIIWSNKKYTPGDYKIIGNFHHLVANGLNSNVGQWHPQSVDLRELYTQIGGTGAPALTVLGFFCDSDNTGVQSEAFFSDVTLSASAS
ncbi:DUF3047 domain-containing protein [Granulosicoccus antarcticus]|uniref:DUF3047 domain-containing protein n=1 Tax=Granulosicoccus antarcticus TaxID=437505 RepID=UPI0012FD7D4A|nr:DUF3047 domain-containing protein [Granulosicoccus antarcticus]